MAGGDGDVAADAFAPDLEGDGVVGVVLELFLDAGRGVDGLAVHQGDAVADGEAGREGGAVGEDFFDGERFLRGADADLAGGAAIVPVVLVLGIFLREDVEGLGLVAALDDDGDGVGSAGDDAPDDGVAHAHEVRDGVVVNGEDFVAGLEARFVGGKVGLDVADDGGGLGIADRFADDPDDAGEKEGEAEAEERAGEGDDDFLPGRGGREFLARGFGFALDSFHRRHLGQRDVAAGGDGAEDVLDAIDFLGPKRLAEPDGELVDFEAAPFGGEEVAELVDDDEDVKEENDFREGDDGEEERLGAVDDAEGDDEDQKEEQESPKAEIFPDRRMLGLG